MNLQKIIIINGLKAYFIGAVQLLIDIGEGTTVIKKKDGSVSTQPVHEYAHYFAQVCEAYDLKTINKIFIDFEKNSVVISGIEAIPITEKLVLPDGRVTEISKTVEQLKEIII
jgi:hypothetical protein